jgi:hypothetical protein
MPDWALTGGFLSVTRTPDELSIVCPQANVPPQIQCDRDWRCLKVEGPLDLSLIGIFASLTVPLARAGIGIFAVSTYDTDYVLVKEQRLEEVVLVLSQEGHHVRQ